MALPGAGETSIAIIGSEDAHTLNVQCAAETHEIQIVGAASTLGDAFMLAGEVIKGITRPNFVFLNPNIEPNRSHQSANLARVIAESIVALNEERESQISVVGFGALSLATYDPPIPCTTDLSNQVGAVDNFFQGLRGGGA